MSKTKLQNVVSNIFLSLKLTMSVLFECTCSQTILKTYIISYCTSSAWRLKERRLTCFLYFREWRDPIQNRRRKLSFTSLNEACFKFKCPASLNPRFTTILHLCAIEVVLKLSTKLSGIPSGSHITSILQYSTIPNNKWSKFSFLPFKDIEEISHFRVLSKWTPESDASTETADQIRRLISFPVPLELRFGETTISR